MNLGILGLVPCIISFFLMKKEKEATKGKTSDAPLAGNLLWYVIILEFLSPLISQAIFYYGWKKDLPAKAKKANSIGWLVILFWIAIRIIVNFVAK